MPLPAEGVPLDVELSTVANLSVAFNAITRNLGRVVGTLRHLEGAERRAEFHRIGTELGELGDLCHEARVTFWACAGQLPASDQEVVRAAPRPRWIAVISRVAMGVLLVACGVIAGLVLRR
jgi:hypothetical protein